LSKPKTRVIFGTDGVICIAKEKKEKKLKHKLASPATLFGHVV
jgi:hypothetical protein